MAAKDTSDTEPKTEPGHAALAELFHLVKSLIPPGQEVVTVSPETTIAEAVAILDRHDFSQLPVVTGRAVLGVFSFHSLTLGLLKLGKVPPNLGQLPVDEFVETVRFVQPSGDWESILEYLDKDNAVLVGHRDGLEGLITPMDVLRYLHDIARPFVILAEIELSLRRIIHACASGSDLQTCIQNSLPDLVGEDDRPPRLSEMTFDNYARIIGYGSNWPWFSVVFGGGEWQRKQTVAKLNEIRDLRNTVFHFKRQLTEDDLENLAAHRNWLQRKARAFEANGDANSRLCMKRRSQSRHPSPLSHARSLHGTNDLSSSIWTGMPERSRWQWLSGSLIGREGRVSR